jgi:BirA family biotin operon repressor/biotin-[acetyl-CoA-carboxylase] ligase
MAANPPRVPAIEPPAWRVHDNEWMDLPRSAVIARRLEVLERAGSTNDELVRRAAGPDAASWPDLSVVVTDHQTSGRGRLGRSWQAPAGTSLAISVLLRPAASGQSLSPDRFGWMPLLAGLAMTRAVRSLGPDAVMKWPNDVLVAGRKISGILCELLPADAGLIVGAGLNLTIDRDDLPVDTATSLLLEGVQDADPDAALAAFLTELTTLYRDFLTGGGDPASTGIAGEISEGCDTLGRSVRVELPGQESLLGTATSIDDDGRLVIESNGRFTAVAAGDVTHLRY